MDYRRVYERWLKEVKGEGIPMGLQNMNDKEIEGFLKRITFWH